MITLQAVIQAYPATRNTLLSSCDLSAEKIALVYKLDQALETAKTMAGHQSPFSVEITSETIDQATDEAEEMDERFSESWLRTLGQLSLLFNYCA